ncbi:MAG: anaerobic sulfatase maturase [Prevotella sp.]|nr:anaerobic sulfatase maturase [Prevotella sp.]MDE6688686.1 anaerobic sulfatase maturase [Prevotella sp.]
MKTVNPFAHPFYMMAKSVGSTCNLSCRYCYYLEKRKLYGGEKRMMMSDEVLECFVRQYLESQVNSEVLFTWHGGEPLLQPMSFYQKALSFQRHYAQGRHVDNCLQTNGTLLTDDWCRFFHDNGWLIGISIDGPEHLHDVYRCGRNGESTFKKVMQGIELLEKHGVMWNALATVNRCNVEEPEAVYRFFRHIGCKYIQFTPVGPPEEGQIEAMAWGHFLCRVFDEWVQTDVGDCYVNIFEATLANYMGVPPGMCAMSRMCGHVGAVEWNGDVYSCDHFVFPQYRLGNMANQTLYEMMHSTRQQTFARRKVEGLPGQCKACEWLFTCFGECPRNRCARTVDGEEGLNCLCEGYRMYFSHVDSFMRQMAEDLKNEEL